MGSKNRGIEREVTGSGYQFWKLQMPYLEEGMHCCEETAKAAAEALKIPGEGVLVGSTGVIGMQMPIHKLKQGIQIWRKRRNPVQKRQMQLRRRS